MLRSKVSHCETIEEFYEVIRRDQEKHYKANYCAHHDAVQKLLEECDSYKELGVHQGASAAAALLSNPKKVELVDNRLGPFNGQKDLFETYCSENNIELIVKGMSSLDSDSVSDTQVLLIDSCHQPDHLTKELELHHESVSDYMVFHDTSMLKRLPNDALYNVIEKFCNDSNGEWEIFERYTENVGYTVIKRVK